MIEVLQPQVMSSFSQVDLGGVGLGRAGAPAVNNQLVVDPQPRTVINQDPEAVGTGAEVQIARPAGGEVVCRYTRSGRMGSPIEVDITVVAHQNRPTAQTGIVEVLALPVRIGLQTLPGELGQSPAASLVILQPQAVRALGQADVGGVGCRLAIAPLVNHQIAVNPQADPIICVGVEAISTGREIQAARPTGGEVVSRHAGSRCILAPIEVDLRVVANQHRSAA